jgi:hypothetical protein
VRQGGKLRTLPHFADADLFFVEAFCGLSVHLAG